MGPTFATIALGMLVNIGIYENIIAEALHTGILFYLSGLLSLLAGLAIINLHNTWCADWRVIITILGWLMTVGGIIRIVVPQVAVSIGSTVYMVAPLRSSRR
jgi:positive regulator of sigma E activity